MSKYFGNFSDIVQNYSGMLRNRRNDNKEKYARKIHNCEKCLEMCASSTANVTHVTLQLQIKVTTSSINKLNNSHL